MTRDALLEAERSTNPVSEDNPPATTSPASKDVPSPTLGTTEEGPRAAWYARHRHFERRGMPGQRQERDAERDARLAAVFRAKSLRSAGVPAAQVADLFDVGPRTLLRWTNLAARGELVTKALGRPAKRAALAYRAALLKDLSARPRKGVPTLRQHHPKLGVRELQELAARFRSVRTTRKRDKIEALTWRLPGSVWAVDFTDAGLHVDGAYPYLLLVRDLATGYTLLSLPCESQDAATVQAALEGLFAREGAPLILKADNGSGFVADATRELLALHEVLLLRSPPGTPAFNGSCEAGVGSIKTRAHHLAAAAGRVTRWSSDDVEAARLEANHAPGPRKADLTPAQRWSARAPLCPQLRADLRAEVLARVASALAEREQLVAVVDDDVVQDLVRAAIAGSLRACSLLSSRLVSIPARRGPRRSDRLAGQPEEVTSST